MSAFNPNQKQLSPQEWQYIASETIAESNAQYLVIGGIIGGGIMASATGFAPTGILFGAWLGYNAWKLTQEQNRNETAISQHGCIAHILKGDNFQDFCSQVGVDEVLRQINWAYERNYKLSVNAQEFLESHQKPIPNSPVIQKAVEKIHSAITRLVPVLQTGIDNQQDDFDLIAAMSERISNHLIIGAQGSGKGLTVSNALDVIKIKHPDTTIFYIDPKGDEKETGYFTGRVDILKRGQVLEWKPSKTVEWFKSCIKEFQSIPGKKLLILDEATYLSSLMKNEGEGNWFKSLVIGLVSVGDSAGWNIWIVALNPNTDDIGISGGVRSQFMSLALITADNLATYTALISTKWLPSDKKVSSEEIQSLCSESPVNRVYYYGQFNDWLPLPKLTNFSGYDRDSRTFSENNLVQRCEPSEPTLEPLNRLVDKDYENQGDGSEERFTPLNLSKEQVLALINALNSELNQTALIERLWQCKKGGSAAWKEAYSQFKKLMGEQE